MASWPVAGEVATGASVATGDAVATGASVATGGSVTTGAAVGVGVGIRELHEQAMITIPAMAPIKTNQNLRRISIRLLLSK